MVFGDLEGLTMKRDTIWKVGLTMKRYIFLEEVKAVHNKPPSSNILAFKE